MWTRLIIGFLVLILLRLHYPLWLGERGLPGVWQRQARLQKLQETAQRFVDRNNRLKAEVEDLRRGGKAITERAREDLGMIRKDEIFIRIVRTEEMTREGQTGRVER